MIEFFNIYKKDKKILNNLYHDFKLISKKNNFILGDFVERFENKFSKYVGSKYTITCANGTDAIFLGLKALNLPKDSEVILPAMTYCSTVFSVINAGLKPVLVDIEPNSPLMDINLIKDKITKKTSVIIPVHLHGSVVDINSLKKISKINNIKILDDAAQAHGARDCSNCPHKGAVCCKKGALVGSLTDITAFSFYPGKNLGAYGDGGGITTNNYNTYIRLKKLRNLGSIKKFKHEIVGYNSRLDTLQAAILLRKIEHLDINNNKRKMIAEFYKKNINDKTILLKYSKGCSYHQFAIKSKNKKNLIKSFIKNKIPFGEHYPVTIHKLQACRSIFIKQSFPNSENFAKKILSLPIDPNLTKKQLFKIIKVVNSIES